MIQIPNLNRLLKNPLGVLRQAQDERTKTDIVDDFPFMLRLSKHSEFFQQPAKVA